MHDPPSPRWADADADHVHVRARGTTRTHACRHCHCAQASENVLTSFVQKAIKEVDTKSAARLAQVTTASSEAIKQLKAAKADLDKAAEKAAEGSTTKIYNCLKAIQLYNPKSDKCEANPMFPLGSDKLVAGATCAAIKTSDSKAASGMFWVLNKDKRAELVYCDMSGKGVRGTRAGSCTATATATAAHTRVARAWVRVGVGVPVRARTRTQIEPRTAHAHPNQTTCYTTHGAHEAHAWMRRGAAADTMIAL